MSEPPKNIGTPQPAANKQVEVKKVEQAEQMESAEMPEQAEQVQQDKLIAHKQPVYYSITTSGGLAGFGDISQQQLEFAKTDIPKHLQNEFARLFTDANFKSLQTQDKDNIPDSVNYHLAINMEGNVWEYDFTESQLPDEYLDLLDDLKAEVKPNTHKD